MYEQGVIPAFTVEGRRYELQHGLISADELIRSFDSQNRFQSDSTHYRECIDEYEFQEIVSKVLSNNSDVASYEFFSMAVEIKLNSRSRKQKWTALLDFNDEGRITGRYRYTQRYEGASQPWTIGDKISRIIRSSLYK